MRILLITCLASFLCSCNSSGKKDPNKAMDDTARMDKPPATTANIAIEPVKIAATEIPAVIKVKGKVQEAWKWKDELGENIFITTNVAPYKDKNKNEFGEEGETAEIYAYHFTNKDVGYTLVWQMNEAEKACPFDITCGFAPGSATFTDLDKDGIAEVKVQYSLACRSDVSPAVMKLNLHEGNEEFLLKGLMWLPYSPDLPYTVTEKDVNLESSPKLKEESAEMLRTFGRYESEKGFAKAPPEFLTFVRTEWLKYSKEKMGE